jgi:hypothetical protein
VSTTPAISCSPAINLSPVSTTSTNNPCQGFSVIAGVVDTGDKFLTGVNDTTEKLFTGAKDTADKTVLPISTCLHLKMKN